MTREVAIKAIQDFIGWFKEDSLIRKALDMAIQALSQEPCDDAVSREAVIEAVSEGCQEWRGIYGRCEELINALPSVTQKSKTGHWILDETDNSITCDKCGCLIWANDISNGDAHYCPNCGAKMESEDKE